VTRDRETRESGLDTVITMMGPVPGEVVTCQQCGEEFVVKPRSHGVRFCRAACRARWHVVQRERSLQALTDALATATALVNELRQGGTRWPP